MHPGKWPHSRVLLVTDARTPTNPHITDLNPVVPPKRKRTRAKSCRSLRHQRVIIRERLAMDWAF
jgi:hypothetical protein